jgi:hypothetical protein
VLTEQKKTHTKEIEGLKTDKNALLLRVRTLTAQKPEELTLLLQTQLTEKTNALAGAMQENEAAAKCKAELEMKCQELLASQATQETARQTAVQYAEKLERENNELKCKLEEMKQLEKLERIERLDLLEKLEQLENAAKAAKDAKAAETEKVPTVALDEQVAHRKLLRVVRGNCGEGQGPSKRQKLEFPGRNSELSRFIRMSPYYLRSRSIYAAMQDDKENSSRQSNILFP